MVLFSVLTELEYGAAVRVLSERWFGVVVLEPAAPSDSIRRILGIITACDDDSLWIACRSVVVVCAMYVRWEIVGLGGRRVTQPVLTLHSTHEIFKGICGQRAGLVERTAHERVIAPRMG